MEPISFIAGTAEEAVAQIRGKLGPEAIVLNVRRVSSDGFSRLWQKPKIEVLACLPETPVATTDPLSETLAAFRQELAEIKEQVAARTTGSESPEMTECVPLAAGNWRIGSILQQSGLLPLYAQQVLDKLQSRFGEIPPSTLAEEIYRVQEVLSDCWKKPAALKDKSMHVFVGPAGAGKTTYLCKWLTQSVLVEGKLARVWRLDGSTANTAESLSVYCEILGSLAERNWHNGAANFVEDIGFIDLPGVDWRKPAAVLELEKTLDQFGKAQIHLVLNGAYDISILLAQFRAFSVLGVDDLVVTHLDEESNWGKIWNLVLGTNCSVRHFSSGQNIPGDLCEASPNQIFPRQFPGKTAGSIVAKQFVA